MNSEDLSNIKIGTQRVTAIKIFRFLPTLRTKVDRCPLTSKNSRSLKKKKENMDGTYVNDKFKVFLFGSLIGNQPPPPFSVGTHFPEVVRVLPSFRTTLFGKLKRSCYIEVRLILILCLYKHTFDPLSCFVRNKSTQEYKVLLGDERDKALSHDPKKVS